MSDTERAAPGPRATSVDEVLALYERWGGERYDEVVTQTDHALQTAALARSERAGTALVAAALLHDVGHLLAMARPDGSTSPAEVDLAHEARGAAWLEDLFGPEVTAPIALHVAAKRYLCAVGPDYAADLSAGSTRSLALQGGPMDDGERRAFEADPGSAHAVALRTWDDAGKVEGLEVVPLAGYRDLLERLSRR